MKPTRAWSMQFASSKSVRSGRAAGVGAEAAGFGCLILMLLSADVIVWAAEPPIAANSRSQEERVTPRAGLAVWLLGIVAFQSRACDLCAIYSATDARGESRGGFIFTVAELFVPFRTPQFEGEQVASGSGDFL